MVDPKQTAGHKCERRHTTIDEGSRLGQRLKNRFTMCFTSPSPPPSVPQRKTKSRSRTPLRESEISVERTILNSRHREEKVNLESLECNTTNFRAVIRECQQLRRRQEQLHKDLSLMEKNASEVAHSCCLMIHENNIKLRQTVESTVLMDHVVNELKRQLIERDELIKKLQNNRTEIEPSASSSSSTLNRHHPSIGSTSTTVQC